jgi:glycosyltransferase involved in cell wall biosynthesis
MKIVFSSNSSWSVYNFRCNLLEELAGLGYDIVIIAPSGPYLVKLNKLGYKTIRINIDNSSRSVFSNLRLLWDYFILYQREKPDLILHNAIKPNIYGALVCRILKIPVINNISGIGAIFMSGGLSTALGKVLYQVSQKKVHTVFLQNPTDYKLFVDNKLISARQGKIIPGSGVDLARFVPAKTYIDATITKFCFVGRLIGDKGIYEYIDAAKKIKQEQLNAIFYILGELYLQHPTAVQQATLDQWVNERTVEFLGKTDEVEKALSQFDCIVLPSYREGLSRVLLESCSMAIPAITSDVPGCIDVIEHGKNGFICKAKDSEDLYIQMKKFIALSKEERNKMGAYGRLKIEKEFDEKIVIEHYLKAITQITSTTTNQ